MSDKLYTRDDLLTVLRMSGFAYHICVNCRDGSGHIPDDIFEAYKENIALLRRFAGLTEEFDEALRYIEINERRIKARATAPKMRKEMRGNYERSFVQIGRRDGFHCQYCGATTDLQIDHMLPVSLGGDNDLSNLQILCNACNRSKSDSVDDRVIDTMIAGR